VGYVVPMSPEYRGLMVDWGGVLTASFHANLRRWAQAEGLDHDGTVTVISQWLDAEIAIVPVEENPLHALERGEIDQAEAERVLAGELERLGHGAARHVGLLGRLFEGGVEFDDTVLDVVRQARGAGVRTALLSNSWANEYPRDRWHDVFDELVISGEVAMRKPEPRIFEHTASVLGVPLAECVFVDDEYVNIIAARALGITAIHCTDKSDTAAQLQQLFSLSSQEA